MSAERGQKRPLIQPLSPESMKKVAAGAERQSMRKIDQEYVPREIVYNNKGQTSRSPF